MDKKLEKYYENQFTMMVTPGWQELMEDLKILKETINDLGAVQTENNLFFRKGQLDILELILNRKEACSKVYEDLNNEENV